MTRTVRRPKPKRPVPKGSQQEPRFLQNMIVKQKGA